MYYVIWCHVFMEFLSTWTNGSLCLFLFICTVLFQCAPFSFTYFITVPYKPVCFSMRDRKRAYTNGKGGWEVQREETVIRIYYTRKNIFSRKENLIKKILCHFLLNVLSHLEAKTQTSSPFLPIHEIKINTHTHTRLYSETLSQERKEGNNRPSDYQGSAQALKQQSSVANHWCYLEIFSAPTFNSHVPIPSAENTQHILREWDFNT